MQECCGEQAGRAHFQGAAQKAAEAGEGEGRQGCFGVSRTAEEELPFPVRLRGHEPLARPLRMPATTREPSMPGLSVIWYSI